MSIITKKAMIGLNMQTKKESMIEAFVNTFIGYWISFIVQLIVYPAFGAKFSLVDNLYIGLIFLVVSFGRSYIIRRFFNSYVQSIIKFLNNKLKANKNV